MPQSMATLAFEPKTQLVGDRLRKIAKDPNFIAAAGFIAVVLMVIGLTFALPVPGEQVVLPIPLA
jgi:hypothetical protein